MTGKREPMSDLGQHIFDMGAAMNRVNVAGLGISLPEHHAQVERMQGKLDSCPPLPEGKAACERLSCQRIVDQEQLSGRGWCPQCERLDLTRVQLRKGER